MNGIMENSTEKLIEVWKVIVTIHVSLDRLGSLEHFHGKEASKDALRQFMGQSMNKKIANARRLITEVLENIDPTITEQLESLGENEDEMGYWTDKSAL